MKTLIIYGQMLHWYNFTSDVLLPYFYGKINYIKIFTDINILQQYLNNDDKYNKNYVMPLNENHMFELHQANIKALMPRQNDINIFFNKKKFLDYVIQNNLTENYPKSYIFPYKEETLVIVKPFMERNSVGCYLSKLNELDEKVFTENIVQDYIKNNIEYAGYGVSKEGKIIYSFAYIRDYGDRIYIKGDKNDNTIQHKIEIKEEHINIIEKFLMPIKFTGVFCIDFKIHNNVLIVFEINARLGGSLGFKNNRDDAANIIINMINVFEEINK